jgi:hypothetical protein
VIALLQQGPTPPLPPAPPGQEVSVSGSLEGWDAVVLLLCVAITIGVLVWPLIRAVARRIEAGAGVSDARSELDALHERIRRLEEAQPRMAELEERVDFAERLLTRAQETAAELPRGETR